MSAPIVTPKTYILTYAALLVLTILTVLIGEVPLGRAHMPVAIAIAIAKATLIACFFMHVLVEERLIKIMLAAGILWLVIMMSLTIGDFLTRRLLPGQ